MFCHDQTQLATKSENWEKTWHKSYNVIKVSMIWMGLNVDMRNLILINNTIKENLKQEPNTWETKWANTKQIYMVHKQLHGIRNKWLQVSNQASKDVDSNVQAML